jgi:hypothetical protein
MDENDWALLQKDNDWSEGYNGNELTVAPYPEFVLNQLEKRTLADEPGYQTGLLRDIKKLQFDNRPRVDEVEFNAFAEQYQVPDMTLNSILAEADPDHAWTDVPSDGSAPDKIMRFKEGNVHANRVIKGHVDFSHDIVYIRCHCRKGPSVAPENTTETLQTPTRLLCHLVSNSEIVFGTSQKESKYMTPGRIHPGIRRLLQGKKADGKPAKGMTGG